MKNVDDSLNMMMGNSTFPKRTSCLPFPSAAELLEAYKSALAELNLRNEAGRVRETVREIGAVKAPVP